MNQSDPTLTSDGVLIRDPSVLFLNSGHDDVKFPPIGGQIYTFNKALYQQFITHSTPSSQSITTSEPTISTPPPPSTSQQPNIPPPNPFLHSNDSILNRISNPYIPTCNALLFPKHTSLENLQTDITQFSNRQLPSNSTQFYDHIDIQETIALIQQFNPKYEPCLPYHPISHPTFVQLQHMFSPPQRVIVETLQDDGVFNEQDQFPSIHHNVADTSPTSIPKALFIAAQSFDLNRFLIYPSFDLKQRALTFARLQHANPATLSASPELKFSQSSSSTQTPHDVTSEMKKYLADSCYHHLLSAAGSYFETPFVNPELLTLKCGYNQHTANQFNSFNHLPGFSSQSNYQATIHDIIYPDINKDVHNIVSIAFEEQYNQLTQPSKSSQQSSSEEPFLQSNDQTAYALNLHNYWFNQPNSPTTLHTITEFNSNPSLLPSAPSALSPIDSNLTPLMYNTEINHAVLPLVPCARFFPPVSNANNLFNITPQSKLVMRGKLYSNLLQQTFIQPYFIEQLQGYAAYGQSPTLPFLSIPMDLNIPNEKQTNFLQHFVTSNPFLFRLQSARLTHSIIALHNSNNSLDPLKVSQSKQRLQTTPPIQTNLGYNIVSLEQQHEQFEQQQPQPQQEQLPSISNVSSAPQLLIHHTDNQNDTNTNDNNNTFTPIFLSPYISKRCQEKMPFWYPYSSYIYTFCDTSPQIPAHDSVAIDQLHAIASSRVFDFDTLSTDIQEQVRTTPLSKDLEVNLIAKVNNVHEKQQLNKINDNEMGYSRPSFLQIVKKMFGF